jgi:hypothetical protein
MSTTPVVHHELVKGGALCDAPLRALRTVLQCRTDLKIVFCQSHFLEGRKFCAQAWVGADSVTIFTPGIAGGTLQTRLSEQISDCQVTQLGLRRKLLFLYFRENLYVKNILFYSNFPKIICFYENFAKMFVFQNLFAKICVRHEQMKDSIRKK